MVVSHFDPRAVTSLDPASCPEGGGGGLGAPRCQAPNTALLMAMGHGPNRALRQGVRGMASRLPSLRGEQPHHACLQKLGVG